MLLNSSVSGRIGVSKIPVGQETAVEVLKPFNNLILDTFLNSVNSGNCTIIPYLGSGGSNVIGAYCAVGTGSTPPLPSDVGLVNKVFEINSGAVNNGSKVVYNEPENRMELYERKKIQFMASSAAYNLSEILIGATSSPTTAYPHISRSLFKDGVGNPTTVNIQVGEILIIEYELIFHIPLSFSETRTIKEVPTTVTYFIYGSSTAAMLPITRVAYLPSGYALSSNPTYYKATAISKPSYPVPVNTDGWTFVSGSLFSNQPPLNTGNGIKARTRIALAALTGHPIGSLNVSPNSGVGSTQCGAVLTFDPPITKLGTEVFDLESYMILSRG